MSHLGINTTVVYFGRYAKCLCVFSLPFRYCMLFSHTFFSSLFVFDEREKKKGGKYSFQLIQIRFVTSKASNSVDQQWHKHMSMLICVFRQLSLAKTDSQTKNRKDKSPSKPHTQTRLSHRIILTDTFYLTRRRKCRHKHIRSIIARQISRCVDDWLKSSEFTFHITCEKKIQMNISRPRRKPMHNQLTRPLYTFV